MYVYFTNKQVGKWSVQHTLDGLYSTLWKGVDLQHRCRVVNLSKSPLPKSLPLLSRPISFLALLVF